MKEIYGIPAYFGKSTFAAFGFILLFLLMVLACLLKAAGFEVPFQLIEWMHRSKLLGGILLIILYICSVILTYDIFVNLHLRTSSTNASEFAQNKAYLDLALIVTAIFFCIFVYLFHSFDMLGNIPVGRD